MPPSVRRLALLAACAPLAIAAAAHAQAAAPPPSTLDPPVAPVAGRPAPGRDAPPSGPGVAQGATVSEVVVTAQRLNAARAAVQPSLGATDYSVTNATIQALPGGDNQQLNQIVLQLPGVVQDGFGQLHIRDDHNGLQYRINGVILPEGIAVFGQTLSPRLVEKLDLITGALPAQYGLRTAGIIDITTKSRLADAGGEASIYGGSHGLYQPSVEYGGQVAGFNLFASLDFRRSQLGIESPDGSSTPAHDRTDQAQAFLYVDRVLSENDRIAFTGGYSDQRFQIPNPAGLNAATDGGGFTLNGRTDFPSYLLNERQRERTGFVQASFLHDAGPITLQASAFARFSALTYTPDAAGELLFNGQAQAARKEDTAGGVQVEGVWRATTAHTIRGGVILQTERGTSRTDTLVFPTDASGAQSSGTPLQISERGGQTQNTYSFYLQDEWRFAPHLVLNFGGRYDTYDGYRSEDQFSPRVNLVWEAPLGITAHAGYARYFNPAPFELVGTQTVGLFQGTTGASPLTQDTTPFAERQNYYDVGFLQRVPGVRGLTFSVDGYYRVSKNLVDEGQFGAPIILTPFNYAKGKVRGVELALNYTRGPWTAYVNGAYARALGKNIVSSQFAFDPAELAFIRDHYIFLDHDQTWTSSAGVSYAFRDGVLKGTKAGADLVYGSGLRTDGVVPNGGSLPEYVQVNLTASHEMSLPRIGSVEARVDVTNVFDETYEIRDGTGVGVGAPQYGPRRGVFVGLTKFF